MGFGVTYRFGSIYNTVVNPRFRNFGPSVCPPKRDAQADR
jgi:hypothetical protein